MAIKLFVPILALSLLAPNASAYVPLANINSAITCNSSLDRKYWIGALTETYGAPIREEGGALWFRGKDELYGAPIKELFVSSKPGYQFVGVLLNSTPDKLLGAIKTARGYPTNLFETATDGWVGANGMHLKWHQQKYAKIFCIGVGRYVYGEN